MKKFLYSTPNTKVTKSLLNTYIMNGSLEVDIDDEEADRRQPEDPDYEDGDALGKEITDIWGNVINKEGIW